MSHHGQRSSGYQDGFVLIAVIWIAGILAVVATTFTLSVRAHIRAVALEAVLAKAEGVADGLVQLTAYQLSRQMAQGDTAKLPALNGSPVTCRTSNDTVATIRIQDQGGLVDLNRASAALLAKVITSTGTREQDALRAAHALIDFRDSDHAPAGGGMEEATLVPRGPGIKNAAFQSVDEIAQTLPETAVDLKRLAAYLTIYSRQEGFDPKTAPADLRRLIASHESERFHSISQRRYFAIDVEAVSAGVAFRRIAIIALVGEPARPFAILDWRIGDRAPPMAETPAKACDALYPA